MTAGTKRKISVTVDEVYMKKVDALAAREERKVSQIIEFALRDYFAKLERKKSKAAQELQPPSP